MSKFKHGNLIYLIFFTLFFSQISFADYTQDHKAATIYDLSIMWKDEKSKLKLLKKVPAYDDKTIQELFDAYLNPSRFYLSEKKNIQQHNIQFLNAHWGPLHNPFAKYPRPAKVFIFYDNLNYALAPLVKNLSDGNFYIFDKNYKQPILLNKWVNEPQHKQDNIRFNICTKYGNLPTDSCKNKSYQDEVKDSEKDSSLNSRFFSAKRSMNTHWRTYLFRESTNDNITIYDTSISWDDQINRNALLHSVVSWPSYEVIKDNFEKMRNIRYFQEANKVSFLRRISWLYPDDGCWTRAAAVLKDLFGPLNNFVNTFPRPAKIFAFGNLCANTPNQPYGFVMWWFHTAPIVKDAETNQTYVLDPSINMHMPLTVEKWMQEISSHSGGCAESGSQVELFNICNGYGSQPFDSCTHTYSNESASALTQLSFLVAERERQVELNRDANAVLGNRPPWGE